MSTSQQEAPAANDEKVACTGCQGTGRVLAIGADTYAGETDFCVWCRGTGEEMTQEEIDEAFDNL